MRKHSKAGQGLRSSQKSIMFSGQMVKDDPLLNRRLDVYNIGETMRLIEDTKMKCFPIPGYGKQFKVILDATSPKCERLIIDAIEKQYGREDLENSLYHFFQTCVSVIIAYGFVAYEIVYFSNDKGKIVSFGFTLIPPSAFFVEKNEFKQYVPRDIADKRNLPDKYLNFEQENVLLFQLTDDVKPYYNQMIESLAFIGQNLLPEFAMENLRNPTIPFSLNEYVKSRELALAKATKKIGWNSRNYSNEHKFEYYVWHRQLKFYRFVCQLRESILDTINDGLTRVGKQMNFQAKLSVEGLYTTQDVDDALMKLKKDDLKTFSDILDIFP